MFLARFYSLLYCGLTLLVAGASVSVSLGQTTYYVAANGSDANDGRSASSPWQSLSKVNGSSFQPGDKVLFRRGDTFRGGLLIRQSGSSAQPITFDAYGPGPKPVISGAVPLTNWTSLGNNTWQTTCSACTGRLTSLYRSSNALPLGRYPNQRETNKGYLTIQSHQGSTQLTSRQAIPLNLNTGWNGAEVVVRATQWIIDRYGLSGQSGSVLNLTSANSSYSIQDGWGYFIQNHPATLDQEGEWAFDPNTKTIQLYSTAGNPTNQSITAAVVDRAVDLANVSNVTLSNLSLIQALNANLSVRTGSNLTFANLDITNAAENGVTITGSGQNVLIENNTFRYINNNGITIDAYQNVTFRGNTMRHVGMDAGRSKNGDGQGNGLQTSVGQAMLIENNSIDSVGFNAVSYTSGTTIRKNVISNFCLTKSDGGGIYTWNGNKNTMNDIHVVSNIIYNGLGAPEGTPGGTYSGANGIYLDDCTQNAEVTGNTIFNCTGLGIYLHATSNLTVTGNTSYNNGEGQLSLTDNQGGCLPRTNSIQNNILAGRVADQTIVQYQSNVNDLAQYGTFDNNCLIRPFNDIFKIRAIYNNGSWIGNDFALVEWQGQFGKDMNSTNSPATFNDYSITSTGKSLLDNTFGNYNDGWGTWSPYGNGRADWDNTNQLDGGCLRIAFPSVSNQANSYVIATNNVGVLSVGKTYYLRFDAVASSATKRVEVFLRQQSGSYRDLSQRRMILVGKERRSYEMAFTATADEASAILVYQLWEDGQTVWLDNVQLKEAVRADVNPDDYIKLVYNPTPRDSVVLLNGGFRDAKNQSYVSSVSLPPFTSLLLLKDSQVLTASRPPQFADLTLTLDSDRQVLPTGQPITFHLRVENQPTSTAKSTVSAQWVCRLPANLQFMGGNGLTYANGVLSGTVQNLRAGADTTIIFQLQPTQGGTYRVSAEVTTATLPDPDSTPNSGTGDGEDDSSTTSFRTADAVSTLFESPNPTQRPLPSVLSVQPSPSPDHVDLSLRMTISNRTPVLNDLVTCTIWISNAGGITAGSVQVQNQLPPGLDFVGGADWSTASNLLVANLNNLPAGGIVSTSFQARVTARGQLINRAQISSSDRPDVDSTAGNGFNNGEDDQTQADMRAR